MSVDSMKTWTDTAKNAGMIVAVVDSRKPTPNGIDELASNTKQSFQTNMFDMLPYSLVIQRSLCTGEV
ncbi:hypothetical protein DPMN_054512 [Dreissena polymorpha]|uniref:Uncharacterized protein n=1 Tax=Dreissena polymorpha TaxID=45954 RepID=A0A9D4CNA2_DREPO|nr:hypothetical protein DPMN_054512 [Dreissena polymorpha]